MAALTRLIAPTVDAVRACVGVGRTGRHILRRGILLRVTLPNFLIIGAHKGGTTSLHSYLGAHPDVFVPRALEPSFFALEGRPRTNPDGSPTDALMQSSGAVYTLEEYEGLFADVTSESAVGEKSPAYLTNRDAPHRIRALIPDVRLIAVLRNPIERAFSHYLMVVRGGLERSPFDEAIIGERNKEPSSPGVVRHYVRSGLYAKRIARYQGLFPPEQLRIYLYEDLDRDTLAVVEDIYQFIGVDPTFRPDVSVRYNAKPRSSGRRGLLSRKIPHLSPRPDPRVDSTSVEMPSATRRELLDFYRDDITRLQTLIGRDLSSWLS